MDITFRHWHAEANTNRKAGGLAPREAQHLMALAEGLSAKEIARAFGVSPRTVRHSLERIYGRLGVHRGTAAVAEAIRRGWIAPLLLALIVSSLHQDADELMRVRQPVSRRQPVSATSRVARRDLGSVYA